MFWIGECERHTKLGVNDRIGRELREEKKLSKRGRENWWT